MRRKRCVILGLPGAGSVQVPRSPHYPLPRCHFGEGSLHPGPGAAERLALSDLLGLFGAP